MLKRRDGYEVFIAPVSGQDPMAHCVVHWPNLITLLMTLAIRKRVRVQRGGRVEIQDDALPEGAEAEVIVLLQEAKGDGADTAADAPTPDTSAERLPLDAEGLPVLAPTPERLAYTLADMIGACPTGRTAEEVDRELRALRDEWD